MLEIFLGAGMCLIFYMVISGLTLAGFVLYSHSESIQTFFNKRAWYTKNMQTLKVASKIMFVLMYIALLVILTIGCYFIGFGILH